ncbi:hypothetical protein [Blastomonas sp. UPD001]|jgi:hypothetical protein|uniref:hypothetical protein n=1 Tax=Blastomonas sp. UPD001 TaxID=2217673 RepID=UPI001300B63F|nr:hypothetical protein [Blastomonas sp. UPD001]
MTENIALTVGENTPEYVAHRLMLDIASAEGISIRGTKPNASREWILETYMLCLRAVQHPHLGKKLFNEPRH